MPEYKNSKLDGANKKISQKLNSMFKWHNFNNDYFVHNCLLNINTMLQ